MNRPAVGRLWHAALKVRDLEGCERFYTDILGLTVEWRPDPDNVYLTGSQDSLALHRDPECSHGGTLDHLGFILDVPEAVDAWYAFLTEQGVPVVKVPRGHRDGSRSLYCRDPDGNLIQLLYYPPLAPSRR